MQSSDVIVIGAGPNGMACAHRLATSGRRVTLIEAARSVGGGAGTTEFAAGYTVPGLAHLSHGIDPRVVSGMGLAREGLKFHNMDLPTTALCATGDHLTFGGGYGAAVTGLSPADAVAWGDLRSRLFRFAGVLAPFRQLTPPRLSRGARNEWLRLANLGLAARRLGRDDFREFLRTILINVADAVEDEVTDSRLRGLLAFDATLGAWTGPRSPNSLILLLNRLSTGGAHGVPIGGMGAISAAMAKALNTANVTCLTGTRVARVIVEGDRAVGVVTSTGEELRTGLVVSAIGPRQTFRTLVGPRPLDAGFYTRAGHIRARGAAAKLHLALTGAPDFKGADLRSRLVIAPGVNAVETAFNAVKYGEVPASPVLEAILPTAFDAAMAPAGHHVLSAIVQFAPHDPRDRDAARAAMLENTLAVLEGHAPGLSRLIAHAEMLMPYDIEARFGIDGGNWHHAELSVEQMLFLRPLRDAAQYSTPLPGLWLAGSGSHPGGGVNGSAGWNAAERILREVKP